MATFIFDLLSYDRRAALVRHGGHFVCPLQEPLVSKVPTSRPIASLNQAPPDGPFPFHLFLLMNINHSSKGYLTRPHISTAAGTPPPTQLQFYYSTQAKFVICDCTIESSYRLLEQVRGRTTARNPALRFLWMGLALLIGNIWIALHWRYLRRRGSGPRRVAREHFTLAQMAHFLVHAIEAIYGVVTVIGPPDIKPANL